MLRDSTSLHSDYKNLCNWLALPETKEILQFLKDKAEEADRGARRSPLTFVQTVRGEQVPMDLDKIRVLQDRFTGNAEGLRELERRLLERQVELEAKLKELETHGQEQPSQNNNQ